MKIGVNIKIISRSIIQIIISFGLLFSIDSLQTGSVKILSPDIGDSGTIEIKIPPDMRVETIPEEDIFDAQMAEAKTIYAEAIISDLTGDTLEAAYQFELLFESLSHIDELIGHDEFQTLEFNRLLTAAIDYYEDEAVTLDKVETGFSVAVLKINLMNTFMHKHLKI